MARREQTAEERAHAERMRQARVLARGISDEAWELMRAHAEGCMPFFRDCEVLADGQRVAQDAAVMALRAASREGEYLYFRWLERMRADGRGSLRRNEDD